MIVPGNDPSIAGTHPPYNPRRMPSCRKIVEYDEDIVVYVGGMCGSPCWRVLTVSKECIKRSPVVPPRPPAIIDYQVSIVLRNKSVSVLRVGRVVFPPLHSFSVPWFPTWRPLYPIYHPQSFPLPLAVHRLRIRNRDVPLDWGLLIWWKENWQP